VLAVGAKGTDTAPASIRLVLPHRSESSEQNKCCLVGARAHGMEPSTYLKWETWDGMDWGCDGMDAMHVGHAGAARCGAQHSACKLRLAKN